MRLKDAAPFFCALALGMSLPAAGNTAPYTPASHDVVLLEIPAVERDSRPSLSAARLAFDSRPDDEMAATKLVTAYREVNRQTGDPRFLGYAETVFKQFREATESGTLPLSLRLLRADILQARHAFDEAQAELIALLELDPTMWTAWSMLASLAETRGDYALAQRACAQLVFAGQDLAGATCAASIASLQGRSEAALEQLLALIQTEHSADARQTAWSHVVAAEIALRLDDREIAEALLSDAIALDDSLYARLTLADLLIDMQRLDEVREILYNLPKTDAVLIRLAQLPPESGSQGFSNLLERRMAALQMRGDTTHGREEALFALKVANNAQSALQSARRNWRMQRESIDAQLLLEAALGAGEAEAARSVLAWMDENKSDDRRLLRVREKLEASQS